MMRNIATNSFEITDERHATYEARVDDDAREQKQAHFELKERNLENSAKGMKKGEAQNSKKKDTPLDDTTT